MNIFKVIRTATSTIERIHSEFLAEALRVSQQGDGELFRKFWNLAVGSDESWPVPANVEIKTETSVNAVQRVDITIFDLDFSRCLGVEVKTNEASTTDGQLAAYQSGLEEKYRNKYNRKIEVRMVYLTPFNHEHSPDLARHSRREFCSFKREHNRAVHLSWIDVAKIPLAEADLLWAQHREYVRDVMCAPISNELREFGSFFGVDPMENFLGELEAAGVDVSSEKFTFDSILDIERFVAALKFLIESREARSDLPRKNEMDDDLKARFSRTNHRPKHDALFALADEYPGVWLGSGKSSYGLRVAHQASPGGVSLCTVSENGITIGQKRRAKSNPQRS